METGNDFKRLAALAVLLATLIAACGGDSSVTTVSTTTDAGAGATTADGSDGGAASAAPEKVVLATPEDTVKQLWTFYGVENLPGIVSLYDPKVVKVVGKDTLIGAIRMQTKLFTGDEQIATVQGNGGGASVSWQREIPGKDPVVGSYFLRRGGRDGWLIQYDSSLSTAISNYVRAAEAAKLGPKADPTEAAAAGQAAQRKYDSAFGASVSGGK